MSADVIRDVTIRVSLESGQNTLDKQGESAATSAMADLQKNATVAKKAIEDAHASVRSLMQDPLYRGIHHALVTGSPMAGLHFGINQAINNSISPFMHTQVPGLGMSAMTLGGGVVAGVTVAASALSSALNQITENAHLFDQALARMGETAAISGFGVGSIKLQGAMNAVHANQDTSRYEVMAQNENSRIEREELIRRRQRQIAHRPLAEQQAIRDQMESQGAVQENMQEFTEQMQTLNRQGATYQAARRTSLNDLKNAKQTSEKASDQRQAATHGIHATTFGNIAQFGVTLSTLGIGNPALANPLAGLLGGITPSQEELMKNQSQTQGDKGTLQAKQEQLDLQQKINKAASDEIEVEKRKADAAEKRLGILRNNVALARSQAEAAAEGQRNVERNFGAADPGTQARLRRIQAKADRGEKLNWRERQMAIQFHINAEDEANAQNEEIANRPENANMHSRGRGRAAQKKEEQNKAEADQAAEQQQLIAQINQSNQNIQELKDSIKESVPGMTDLALEIHALIQAIGQLIENGKFIKDKQHSWFGG